MTSSNRYFLSFLFILSSFFLASAQEVTISQEQLPYAIPIIQEGSKSPDIEYRWLENGKVVAGADAENYTIPVGTAAGEYAYQCQVRCADCTDWLSSNSFVVHLNFSANLKALFESGTISVSYSPQDELESYLDKLITVIDSTQETLDISLYNFESYEVYQALQRASSRGVQIRMLYEGAQEDRKENDSTVSHQIEKLGIDVRYVNKINHHKFLISDTSFLLTSSGNWNNEANTVYDENSLWINNEELVLRFRAEFEYMWNNSREFGESFSWVTVDPDSLLAQIVDDPKVDALFTSSNYRTYISSTYGPTFALISGSQNVADRIVDLIEESEESIFIAANHLRSRPISEALIAKKIENPLIDIKVYLDEQEYISEDYNNYQIAQREECLAEATTEGQIRDCLEKNFYYSYELILAGIDVRFKTYSYKWDHTTSLLMHHKYAIFDGNKIATGSYNYSYNAETNSMENVVILDSAAAYESIERYLDNFDAIWNTGRDEGFYNDLLAYLNTDSRFTPLLFPSLALEHAELTTLRQEIEYACPAVTHDYFRDNVPYYSTYLKDIAFTYDDYNRISAIHDNRNSSFDASFSYNYYDAVTEVSFLSEDSLLFQENCQYNEVGDLIELNSPLFSLDLYYENEDLTALDAGQGAHSWAIDTSGEGTLISYSVPGNQDYIRVQWNDNDLPAMLTDADSRVMQWSYNAIDELVSIQTGGRNIEIHSDNSQNTYEIFSSDGDSIITQVLNFDELAITSGGTVAATINYSARETTEKNTELHIAISSNRVLGGRGKNASIEYLLDPYGRVIGSGNLTISREPYSGIISSISDGNILENRTYNDWELLEEQTVTYGEALYYKASYQYDALQRISELTEIVLGDTANYRYTYNYAGQLESVFTNNSLTAQYSYDSYGNRIAAVITDFDYTYVCDSNNRLDSYFWEESGNTKIREFVYNNSGQLFESINKTSYGGTPQVTSSRDYSYTIFGNLDSVSWASQNQTFKYDPYNRQIATLQNGSVLQKLVYGEEAVPLAELNENERIINTFVYADNQTPVLMRKGTVDYYLISDIRGSVQMVVKVGDGSIRQQITYDAFGNVLDDSNPGYTPFAYAGGLYDSRTELLRFGARDYYAETGRWTAEDPIGFLSGDVNFYAYVGNDPVNYIDPSGLSKAGSNQLLSFSKSNFRENLFRLTGRKPANSQAHHIFPQKYWDRFSRLNINIHNPKYGAWWNSRNHMQNARAYNTRWDNFFLEKNNRSQTLNFGRQLMNEYGIPINY